MSPQQLDDLVVSQEFQRHYGIMIAVGRWYVPMPDLVGDAVQQAFIDFMNAAKRGVWSPGTDSSPLLCEIVKRRAIDLWRKEKRCSTENLQKIGEMLMERKRQEISDPKIENEKIILLEKCLQALPEKARELIERHYFQHTTLERLAEEKKVPANSLRKTLSRIRTKLKDCITRKLESQK